MNLLEKILKKLFWGPVTKKQIALATLGAVAVIGFIPTMNYFVRNIEHSEGLLSISHEDKMIRAEAYSGRKFSYHIPWLILGKELCYVEANDLLPIENPYGTSLVDSNCDGKVDRIRINDFWKTDGRIVTSNRESPNPTLDMTFEEADRTLAERMEEFGRADYYDRMKERL